MENFQNFTQNIIKNKMTLHFWDSWTPKLGWIGFIVGIVGIIYCIIAVYHILCMIGT